MLFWKWIYISTALTEFIDSAKKLKRPWNEMPLSHLRKVIPSQNPEAGPASVGNGLCITSNPGADIKLSLLSRFSFIPWEKSSPHFAEQHPFCNFRSIFLSSLLPREDQPQKNQHPFLSVSRDFFPTKDRYSSWRRLILGCVSAGPPPPPPDLAAARSLEKNLQTPLDHCSCLWHQLSHCAPCLLNPWSARCEQRGWKKMQGAVGTADTCIPSWLAQQP